MQHYLELETKVDKKKIFEGILENWFIHIDSNNRFRVVGNNVLTDDFQAALSEPVLYIDTYYWLAETAESFYLLNKKDTSPENQNILYSQLQKRGIALVSNL